MSKADLKAIFDAAIIAVDGRLAMNDKAAQLEDFKPSQIIAVGKAANNMLQGAFDCFGETPALLITKHHHVSQDLKDHALVEVIEAGHPIADTYSLMAGERLLQVVKNCQGPLLMLVSGGASALAECLKDELTFNQWQAHNRRLIASGQTIEQINHWRKAHSKIKDGKLLSHYSGRQLVTLAISDVQGDNLTVIGSGLASIHQVKGAAKAYLVATNEKARQAAQAQATMQGYSVVYNEESLYQDVFTLAQKIAQQLVDGNPGVYIFGGEPTIVLPVNPGNGGRNQSLALAIAKYIAGRDDIYVLVAGTDGTDGPTDAAGAIVDGFTFNCIEGGQIALDQANAGEFLRKAQSILTTGPTGTNVMDLVITLKIN